MKTFHTKYQNQWKNIINANRVSIYQNRYGIACYVFVVSYLKHKKGNITFYDILAHVDEMNVTHMHMSRNQLRNTSNKEWKLYNVSIKDIKEVKLANFQYEINKKNSDKLVFIQIMEDK